MFRLKELIDSTDYAIFTEWASKVPDMSSLHLSKSLLIVHENKLLELNFDPELSNLLREIRYMIIMKRTDLPEEAIELHYRSQYFFESTYNLNLIVQW